MANVMNMLGGETRLEHLDGTPACVPEHATAGGSNCGSSRESELAISRTTSRGPGAPCRCLLPLDWSVASGKAVVGHGYCHIVLAASLEGQLHESSTDRLRILCTVQHRLD